MAFLSDYIPGANPAKKAQFMGTANLTERVTDSEKEALIELVLQLTISDSVSVSVHT